VKRNRSILLAAIVLLFVAWPVIAQTGYFPGQTAEAYAYTHGGYVAQAVVKVLSNGSLDVEIDEAFLPHTLAIVDMDSPDWNVRNTVYYESRGSEIRTAKYVEYDGTVYVGTTVGASLTYVEADDNGEPAGGKDLELLILKNQETMASYYRNIKRGGFRVLTGFGSMAKPVLKTAYGGVTKATSPGYWNFGQTWQGNINAIEEFIEEYGSAFPRSDMERSAIANADGLKFWTVADTLSGATNSDFKDYFGVAQAAISQLKMR